LFVCLFDFLGMESDTEKVVFVTHRYSHERSAIGQIQRHKASRHLRAYRSFTNIINDVNSLLN
jgi:hypothetical protein